MHRAGVSKQPHKPWKHPSFLSLKREATVLLKFMALPVGLDGLCRHDGLLLFPWTELGGGVSSSGGDEGQGRGGRDRPGLREIQTH